MEFKKVEFNKIQKKWDELYNANPMLSPYMDWEFQKIIKRYLKFGAKRIFMKYICFAGVGSDGKIKVIIPLIYGKGRYYIAGDLCATGILDFVYSIDITNEELQECIKFVKELGSITLNKINEKSLLGKYLVDIYGEQEKTICVGINLPNEFDIYFSSLSKHARQNYRTSINRMKRENKEWCLEVLDHQSLSKEKLDILMNVYNKREAERSGKTLNGFGRIVRRYFNPITRATQEVKSSLIAILYIDGEVAGFLSGFYSNTRESLIIPRLAIDSKFSVYCPGELLVIETIKRLLEVQEVRVFDLSRGSEKYKYVLGGQEHYNYSFRL